MYIMCMLYNNILRNLLYTYINKYYTYIDISYLNCNVFLNIRGYKHPKWDSWHRLKTSKPCLGRIGRVERHKTEATRPAALIFLNPGANRAMTLATN